MTEPLIEGPSKKTMRVGVKDGRIIIGVDEIPIAAFYPEQAMTFACLILKHAMVVACGSRTVQEALNEIQPLERQPEREDTPEF